MDGNLASCRCLRALVPEDLAIFHAYRSDAALMRLQGSTYTDEAESASFLSKNAAAQIFTPGEWYQVAIVDGPAREPLPGHTKDADLTAGAPATELLGDIGINLSADGTTATVGFTLRREHHGRGVATRAVSEAIALIWSANPQTEAVIAEADVCNGPSMRLLERLGFRRVGSRREEYQGEMCEEHLYRLDRPALAAGP